MRNALLVGATLGLALSTGCQNERKQVATQEQDLSDARQDAAKAEADTRREAAEKKGEIDAKAQKEIAKEQHDVAKAEQQVKQAEGTGGSGIATAATVTGVLKSSIGNGLTVTERTGAELKLKTDQKTHFTLNGTAVKIDDFREGTPLRVAYETEGDNKIAREVMVLAPMRKK